MARGGSGAKAPPLAARPTLTPRHRRAIVASSAFGYFSFLKYLLLLLLVQTRDRVFFPSFFYVVFSQSLGLGWERGSGGVAVDPGIRGQEGCTKDISISQQDGGEGGEEAVHMPTGVTYVTEKHSFLVKGTLTHLTLCVISGGAGRGGD